MKFLPYNQFPQNLTIIMYIAIQIFLFIQDGIEKYDKTKLTHTETMEKNTLPTKEVIEMEKSA